MSNTSKKTFIAIENCGREQVPRQRAHHSKRKTGCGTCKARHLRCDENKPSCLRCQRAGLKCAGYALPQILSSEQHTLISNRKSIIPTSISIRYVTNLDNQNAIENRAFEYFCLRSLRLLCGLFPVEVWTKTLLRIQHSNWALRHAVLAIGFNHEAAELSAASGSTIDSVTHVSPSNRSQAFLGMCHYGQAIHSFKEILASGEADITIVGLLASLLIFYEFLGGRRQELMLHLRNALFLVRCQRKEQKSFTQDDYEIEAFLSRLTLNSSHYGRPRKHSTLHPLPNLPPTALEPMVGPKLARSFQDLTTARDSIYELVHTGFMFGYNLKTNRIGDENSVAQARLAIQVRFSQWLEAFNALANASTDSIHERRGRNLLLMWYELGSIYVASRGTPCQVFYDQYTASFTKIIHLLRNVLSSNDGALPARPDMFAFDSAYITPLFYTATRCRHPTIRREALALLKAAPRHEECWDADVAIKAMEIIIAFEEQDGVDMENPCASQILERNRVHDVDIRERHSTGSKDLVLVWKPDGIDADYSKICFQI